MTAALAWFTHAWELFTSLAPYITTFIFLGAAVALTLQSRFAQIRMFPRFIRLITGTINEGTNTQQTDAINPFHALFTAMGTTIGMGNIVGPGVAILMGGPGALLWLLIYIFFASVTKFTEVTFALDTRTISENGKIIGGPMRYLHTVSPFLGYWYAYLAVFLFVAWSSLQANTLANIFVFESVPKVAVGTVLAFIVFIALRGGAQRVGDIASKLVPTMFVLYMFFAIVLLTRNAASLGQAFTLIWQSAFTPHAVLGCFAGATVLQAMRAGTYRAIFITEAGMGTSSIAHAMATTKNPTDQGILAMFSMLSDAIISLTSGLLVLVLGVCHGPFRSTMIYEAFNLASPVAGRLVLLTTVTLFVVTTAIGNSFNGMQTFASLTRHRFVDAYIAITVGMIFMGPLLESKLVWDIADIVLALVALPNIIGLLILAYKRPQVIKV